VSASAISENTAVQMLEPLTAQEYLSRFEPETLGLLLNPDSTLRDYEQQAAAIAAGYGLESSGASRASSDGKSPRVIWDLVFSN
jgi:hypothetical protein